MFGCFRIELILFLELILKLGFVALDSRLDVYIQIYSSTHFHINISKHKSLYIQLAFNQRQFIYKHEGNLGNLKHCDTDW